jgi:hypothetical protein
MRLSTRIAMLMTLLFVPLIASAQFKDLDVAMGNLTRGFGSGDAQAIVSGIGASDHVQLQFPGLVTESGFFGRDQVAYLLDGLFNKVKPVSFEQLSARKVSAEGQYHITARWTIQVAGKPEARDLYIVLRNKDNTWSIVSVRSASQ